MWYHDFEVVWYDEGEPKIASGIIPADSLSEAVSQLELEFGNDLDKILFLSPAVEGKSFFINNYLDGSNFALVPKKILTDEQLEILKDESHPKISFVPLTKDTTT